MPVVVLRQVLRSMVQKTVVPQLPSIESRRRSLRVTETDPHGPDCSAFPLVSPVAVRFLVVDLCCAGRADSPVPPWRRHSCSRSCVQPAKKRLPNLQFIKVVDTSFVTQRLIPMEGA